VIKLVHNRRKPEVNEELDDLDEGNLTKLNSYQNKFELDDLDEGNLTKLNSYQNKFELVKVLMNHGIYPLTNQRTSRNKTNQH